MEWHEVGNKREVSIRSLPKELQTKWALECGEEEVFKVPDRKTGRKSKKAAVSTEAREQMARRWALKSEKQKAEGDRRANILLSVEALYKRGVRKTDAVSVAADQNEISESAIYKWFRQVKGWPRSDWPMVLTANDKGRTKREELPDAAWQYIKADYLRPEAPALTAVYDRAKRQGYLEGWTLPSYKTVLRRVNAISVFVRVLAREGVEALERMYPAQERDKSVFHAMEAVNADGHKFDVFVKWPDGEISRPLMAAWQDVYSGKYLAWRVAKTENSDTIRLSFGDMISTYGIPAHAYLDNGRGFASKWLTGGMQTRFRFKVKEEEPAGILTRLGVEVHWATPYHGQSKPIERGFRDFCEYIAKHPAFAGAYTGNNPMAKPENYGSRAVPFALFMEVLDQEIAAHNARTGRRSKICAGRSIDQAFEASYAVSQITPATEHQKLFCLMAAEAVTPKRTSGEIHLNNNRYWCEELTEYRCQKVTVRFDPDNLHSEVWVYTLDGEFIALAPCIAATGFNDTQAAREHNRKRKQFVKAGKQQLKAMRDMDALSAAIPNVSVDEPDKVHVTFSKPIREQQKTVIAEEQLSAPRISRASEQLETQPSSAFNSRLKGFIGDVQRETEAQQPARTNSVRSAVRALAGKENA